MTQAPDTQEKRALLKCISDLAQYIEVDMNNADELLAKHKAFIDQAYAQEIAALEKAVEKVDLDSIKKEVSGKFPMMTAAEAIDHLASRHPDLFGGKNE